MIDDLWWYRARPARAVDGDTIEVVLDHGMNIHSTQRLRLLDVWAPERNEPGGTECTSEAASWLAKRMGLVAWPLLAHTLKDRRTFDRYVADVYDPVEADHLNDHMRRFIAERGVAGGTGG